MKFRSFLLAAAGIAGTVSVAAAQPAPTPAPPPAAPAQPAQPSPSPGAAPAPDLLPAEPAPPAGAPAPAQPAAPGAAPAAAAPAPGAGAQPTGPDAQPTGPADPPPPAPPPPAPPPSPSGPTLSLSLSSVAQPPGPDTASEEAQSSTLIWRGTTFTWNQAGTTTVFGIGRDNIGSEDEFYGWDFTFRPNVYLVDLPKDKVTVSAEIGWNTELTTSNFTSDRRETQFKDLVVGARYGRALWESGGKERGEYSTGVGFSLFTALPTSPLSYEQGKYLTLAVGPDLTQKIKLLGNKADGLNNVTVGLGLTYAHLFSRSYTPTNPDLARPRQNATGQTIYSDQLSAYSFDVDRLTTRVNFALPLYKDLTLATGFRLISRWKHDFEAGAGEGEGCDVSIPNQPCVQADRLEDRTLYHVNTGFDVAMSYPIYDVVGLTLGYSNSSTQVGQNGERRNIFYSPDAQFFLDITANLDVIYSKATRRGDKRPASAAKPQKKTGF